VTNRYNRPETTARRTRRLSFAAVSLIAVAFVSAANLPAPPLANAAASETPIVLAQATTPTANTASPLDEPIRLITEAKKAMADVKDYSCVLVKKERMGDKAPVENVIALKVRAEPFSVNLRWVEPKALAGQEACYVAGKNDGKMRVKSAGLLGNLGFLSLDADDARAKATSKHAISESGLANLIEQFAAGWEKDRKLNLTKVRLGDYEFNKRKCTRVEATQSENPNNQFLFQRCVVFFDKETHLPIRVECYDWSAKEGQPGELVEMFSYVNLRLNVGLGDDVFNH
jgi:hypothetical protein